MQNLSNRLSPARIQALSRQGKRWWPQAATLHSNVIRGRRPSWISRTAVVPTTMVLVSALCLWSVSTKGKSLATATSTPPPAPLTQQSVQSQKLITEAMATEDAVALQPDQGDHWEVMDTPPSMPSVTEHANLIAPPTVDEQALPRGIKKIPLATTKHESEPSLLPELELDLAETDLSSDDFPEFQENELAGSGLLPALDDPVSTRDPEITSVKEIFDDYHRIEDKSIVRYRKDFPEIFVAYPRNKRSSTNPVLNPTHRPSAEAREVAERARNWRSQRNRETGEDGKRRPGIVGKLRGLLQPREQR